MLSEDLQAKSPELGRYLTSLYSLTKMCPFLFKEKKRVEVEQVQSVTHTDNPGFNSNLKQGWDFFADRVVSVFFLHFIRL